MGQEYQLYSLSIFSSLNASISESIQCWKGQAIPVNQEEPLQQRVEQIVMKINTNEIRVTSQEIKIQLETIQLPSKSNIIWKVCLKYLKSQI